MTEQTPETPKALTDAELAAAFWRVSKIFDSGCDRCDGNDLTLLEEAGLMKTEICRDAFGQDTLEVGDTMWVFIPQVERLRTIFEATQTAALASARNDALGWRPSYEDLYAAVYTALVELKMSDETHEWKPVNGLDVPCVVATISQALLALKAPPIPAEGAK